MFFFVKFGGPYKFNFFEGPRWWPHQLWPSAGLESKNLNLALVSIIVIKPLKNAILMNKFDIVATRAGVS